MISLKNHAIAGTAAMIATLVTVGAATPLRAEPVSRTVAYGDLDLATDAGHAVLARRIRLAVNHVCGPLDQANRYAVLDCRHRARATANMNARLAAVDTAPDKIQLAAAR